MNETPESAKTEEISLDDTTITEQLPNTDEAEPIEVSYDAPQEPCEESLCVDSLQDDVDPPREDVDSVRVDVDSPLEASAREDPVTPPRTPRQRSRSIGEKLSVDKLLVKQGRAESSDNLKKVKMRGRVRRRERKAKSDLQLSSSGFVKRHTQIIEEQMLYSLLMNSDKTLATLAVDFYDNDGGNNSNISKQNGTCEAQCSQTNMDVGTEITSVTKLTDSQENSGKLSGESGQVFENDCLRSTENECCSSDNVEKSWKNNQENSKQEFDSSYEQNSIQILDKNSQTNPENFCGKKRCEELQDIVQEVNAEAKRDIVTQSDTTKTAVVSQNELRHTNNSDDVTIDQMTWIDLTHHHGDVVKRRSAAFENNAKQEPWASLPQSRGNLSPTRDNLPPSRDGNQPSMCQEREETRGNRTGDNTKPEAVFHATNKNIPKLDLGVLMDNECCIQRSNSIIVEDYNSWEVSSVRERTKILENIIAKTGGSFPSPRSRVGKLSEVEGQRMDDLNIGTSPEECRTFHHSHDENHESSCPIETRSEQPDDDSVIGDAPVRSLVDKFEDLG